MSPDLGSSAALCAAAAPTDPRKYTAHFAKTADNVNTEFNSKLVTEYINNELVELCQALQFRIQDMRCEDHAELWPWHRGLRMRRQRGVRLADLILSWSCLLGPSALHPHTGPCLVMQLLLPLSGVLTDN